MNAVMPIRTSCLAYIQIALPTELVSPARADNANTRRLTRNIDLGRR